MQPFQCDLCWFRNLKNTDPDPQSMKDNNLLIYIRRANLDMLWSTVPRTVATNKGNIHKGLLMCRDLDIEPPYPALGPFPVTDNVGFTVALQILKASKLPGRYAADHQQVDTIRSLRTAYTNLYESSWAGNMNRYGMRGEKGSSLRYSNCPTNCMFFEKFMKGMTSRMGRDIRSNAGLPFEVLMQMIKNAENDLNSEDISHEDKRFTLLCTFYFIICYGASLRGSEGFMMEVTDLIRNVDRGKEDPDIPHVVIPLLGRFKGETGERSHLLLLVNKSNSGLPIRLWVERVVALLKLENHVEAGPVMCNKDGSQLSSHEVDEFFKEQVERVQSQCPYLIESKVNVQEDFGIFRSMRKGSESRATEMGVCTREIDLINRWRKIESNQRKKYAHV